MMQLGEITEPKIDQAGPPPTGEFTYVDISSVDNNAKRIVELKRLPADSAPSRARQKLRSGDAGIHDAPESQRCCARAARAGWRNRINRLSRPPRPQWRPSAVALLAADAPARSAMSELVQGALYPAVRPKDIRAFELPMPSWTSSVASSPKSKSSSPA
ncbi:MAG: hypothetical protein U1F11_16000 [Steroidobacteraceae bacterium]